MQSELWNDIYNGEMLRTGDAELARRKADNSATLAQQGTYYVKGAWKRTLVRHWKKWWEAYVYPSALVGIVVFVVWIIPGPTSHWGGIARNDVAVQAESDAVKWYKQTYDAPLSNTTRFDANLFPQNIFRIVRGKAHYWYVRFETGLKSPDRHLCVLLRDNVFYVRHC